LYGVTRICPMCQEVRELLLTKEQTDKYVRYLYGREKVQEVFSELGPVEREYLKTGYCYKCQALLFGTTNKPNLDIWR